MFFNYQIILQNDQTQVQQCIQCFHGHYMLREVRKQIRPNRGRIVRGRVVRSRHADHLQCYLT